MADSRMHSESFLEPRSDFTPKLRVSDEGANMAKASSSGGGAVGEEGPENRSKSGLDSYEDDYLGPDDSLISNSENIEDQIDDYIAEDGEDEYYGDISQENNGLEYEEVDVDKSYNDEESNYRDDNGNDKGYDDVDGDGESDSVNEANSPTFWSQLPEGSRDGTELYQDLNLSAATNFYELQNSSDEEGSEHKSWNNRSTQDQQTGRGLDSYHKNDDCEALSNSDWSRSDTRSPEWEMHVQQQEESEEEETPWLDQLNERYDSSRNASAKLAPNAQPHSIDSFDEDILKLADELEERSNVKSPDASISLHKRNDRVGNFESADGTLRKLSTKIDSKTVLDRALENLYDISTDIMSHQTQKIDSEKLPEEDTEEIPTNRSPRAPTVAWQPTSWLAHAVILSRNLLQSVRDSQAALTRSAVADPELRRIELASQTSHKETVDIRKNAARSRAISVQRVQNLRKLVKDVRTDPNYVIELQKSIDELESQIEQMHTSRIQTMKILRREEKELEGELQQLKSSITKLYSTSGAVGAQEKLRVEIPHRPVNNMRLSQPKYAMYDLPVSVKSTNETQGSSSNKRDLSDSNKASSTAKVSQRLSLDSDKNEFNEEINADVDEEEDDLQDELDYMLHLEHSEEDQITDTDGRSKCHNGDVDSLDQSELQQEHAIQIELERIQQSVSAIDARLAELSAGLPPEQIMTGGWEREDHVRYEALRVRYPQSSQIALVARRLIEDEGLSHLTMPEIIRHDEWHQETANATRAKKILVERYKTLKTDLESRIVRREFEAAEVLRKKALAEKREIEKRERAKTLQELKQWKERKRLMTKATQDAKNSADRARAAVESSVRRAEKVRLRALVEAHKRAQEAQRQEREAEERIRGEADHRARAERMREQQKRIEEKRLKDLEQRALQAQMRQQQEEITRAQELEVKARAANRFDGVVTRDPNRLLTSTRAAAERARQLQREHEEQQMAEHERARLGTKSTMLDRPQTGRVASVAWRKG